MYQDVINIIIELKMSDSAATTEPKMAMEEQEKQPGVVAIEPFQIAWGLSATSMVVYGYLIRTWYKNDIEANNISFPNTSGTDVSEEWALGTLEVDAWNSCSDLLMGLYGVGWFTWAANMALGQTGNDVHNAFYVATQVLQIAPFVSLFSAFKIQNTYLPNGAVYGFYFTQAGSVDNEMLYLYDPDETDETAFNFLDYSAYYNRLFSLFALTAFSFGVNSYAVQGIKEDWTVQKLVKDNNDKMNDDASAEEEEEEVCVDEFSGEVIDC